MAVYVDNVRIRYGRMIMCHMIADTSEELNNMADLIGVSRRWRQNSGTNREHYDICLNKRASAIQRGAREITARQLVELMRRRNELPD